MEKEKTITNHPHLTALHRTALSSPVRWLKDNGKLRGRILDFGCGHGFDTEQLQKEGFDIIGYDNYYRTEIPTEKFDTIICIYVLNVLQPVEQADVLMTVSQWLKPNGKAYFAVRRDLTSEGFRLHAIYKEYTYQCNVKLPYSSIELNRGFELYEYEHYNRHKHSDSRCPFCNLAKRVELICETATMVAFYDGFPVSPGHALIIPKRHVADYFDLTPKELQAMQIVLKRVKEIVDERYHPDGYNIGVNVNKAAGQSVFHVHMHLIPRYKGDMPNPKGGVRGVIPEKRGY